MSSVQELRKMFQNKGANQNGPPIKFRPPSPPKQPKKHASQQQHPKESEEQKEKEQKIQETKAEYEEPRMSVADLKKNFQGKLNFTGGVHVFPPQMPRQTKKQQTTQTSVHHTQQNQKEQQTSENKQQPRIPTFRQSQQLFQQLHKKIRETNIEVSPPKHSQKGSESPTHLQPNFTKKKREQSYIDVHLKTEDQLSAEERVRQIMGRIFIRKQQPVQLQEEEVHEQLRLRRNSNKGKRNLGSFDDA